MKKFVEKNMDVLQNIEFGIVTVYRSDPTLLDIDAKDAIDALARHYHAEEAQRRPPELKLSDRAQRVFSEVHRLCEWRLGRQPDAPAETVIPVSELVSGLREIQKSIPRWSQRGGRRGYLDFVSEYIR